MATLTETSTRAGGMTKDEKFVIFASSLGTVFEWYDFYLYATLAPFFAALFFPPGNETAALLSAFATYAAGFLVRPFGALVFGRIGDLVGRKYTFLVTIVVMGAVDLPGRPAADLRDDRLAGAGPPGRRCACCRAWRSAASTAARRPTSPSTRRTDERGYATSWIQTTATLGFFLSLLVIGLCRVYMDAKDVRRVGLAHSVPGLARPAGLLGLHPAASCNESPVFQKMKEEGKGSKAPLTESFLRYPNNKYVLLALLGATAGQGVVWYTGQFYALFFLHASRSRSTSSPAYIADRRLAADRHAVLHLLRLAVRQDRPAEDHPGRLPDRGADLLPAVPGADALRQPGPRGVPGRSNPITRRRPTSRPATSTSSSARGRSSPTATAPRTS